MLSWAMAFHFVSRLFLLATPAGSIAAIVIADAWMCRHLCHCWLVWPVVSCQLPFMKLAEMERAFALRRFRTITFPSSQEPFIIGAFVPDD